MSYCLNYHSRRSKSRLTKRSMKRSKSVVDLLLFNNSNENNSENSEKSKNIRQTESVINLREAIVRLAQYFQVINFATKLTVK